MAKIGREQIEAAMAKLPEEDHRLLVWLCTGQVPQQVIPSLRTPAR